MGYDQGHAPRSDGLGDTHHSLVANLGKHDYTRLQKTKHEGSISSIHHTRAAMIRATAVMASNSAGLVDVPSPSRAEAFGDEPENLSMTIGDMLSHSALQHPDRAALASLWQSETCSMTTAPHSPLDAANSLRWTYHDLHEISCSIAASLVRLGCRRNMKLAALLWNSSEWALFFWATAKLGMTFAPVDPRSPPEAADMLNLLKPEVIVAQSEVESAITSSVSLDSAGPSVRIICAEVHVSGWLRLRDLLRCEDMAPSPFGVVLEPVETVNGGAAVNDAALIVFTSGTTGVPKGCVHTNRNLVSQTSDYDPNEDPRTVDKWLVHTPVSHIFAVNNALRAWRTGSTVVFPSKSFDINSSLRALQDEKCTIMSATPTLVKALLSHPGFSGEASTALNLVSIAAMTIRPDDLRSCRKLGAKDTIQAYGMSEGAPLISWSRRDNLLVEGFHAGVGKVLPGVAVRICGPTSQRVLLRNEVGELHVSGDSVIPRYLDDVDEHSFYDDEKGRWLMTGDMAIMDDDGVFRILGRYKDIIIRGGENINPMTLEAALAEEGVEAYIVGIPDEIAGEIPVAVVKLPSFVTRSHVTARASALGPKYALGGVYTLEDLQLENIPTTASGKVKKNILRTVVQDFIFNQKLPHDKNTGHRATPPRAPAELTELLSRMWNDVSGGKIGDTHSLTRMGDSITLLQYCDAVSRYCGAQLCLQDVLINDTIEQQAQLLLSRILQAEADKKAVCKIDVNQAGFGSKPASAVIDCRSRSERRVPWIKTLNLPGNPSPSTLLDTACATAARFGVVEAYAEDVLPIRESFRRLVVGCRPESYHMRVVFRVHNATTQQIREGLKKALVAKPLFRGLSFEDGKGGMLHAILQANRSLFARLIVHVEVKSDVDAEKIWQDDATAARFRPFVFEAEMIEVRESNQIYLSMTFNHSVIDALSLMSWQRDIDNLVSNVEAENPPQTSFKCFSDLLSQYDKSLPAQNAVAFHVQRLRGISRFSSALWPPQRAPGWMISYDGASPLAEERARVRQEVWDGEWNAKVSMFRFPRVGRVVHLPTLDMLKGAGVAPCLLTRAAITVFNILQTGASYAIFNTWESGRSWPFVTGWMNEMLPSAMSIDGPTCQWLLTMTEVRNEETVLEFLQRVGAEYEELKRFEHVPWDRVVAELREEGAVAIDASFRQSFVWDVTLGMAASSGFRKGFKALEAVARFDWPDCGLFWNAFTVNSDSIFFVASWDTAQLNDIEIEACCNLLADVMRKLARQENWDRTIREVFDRRG